MILGKFKSRHFRLWGLLAVLLLAPASARPQTPGQGEVAGIYAAMDRIIETYRQAGLSAEQGLDPPPELLVARAAAIDTIGRSGPLASTPLREALQQSTLPVGAAYVLATMLVLTDSASAGDFVLAALKPYPPAEDLVESFRFGHTLMLVAPHHGAIFAERLAELPESLRFPVPAEGISFPLVGGISWLYAAGDTAALNDLAAMLEDVGKLPPQVSDNLLRVCAMLQLRQLLPLIEQQVKDTPGDSPRLRALIWALGQLDDPRVVPRLAELSRSLKNPELRQEAVFALSELQTPSALAPLRDALGDKAPGVRSYAVAGLVKLGIPEARVLIREGLGGAERDARVQSDYIRAAKEVGDTTWRPALRSAAEKWPRHELMCKETSLSLARRKPPNDFAPPPRLWPSLSVSELEPARLNERLWDIINAGGLGFSELKKTVLYSAGEQHVQHLEYLRTLLAKNLTNVNLSNWLDVLETLQLVRRRLREDPRPLFAPRGDKPAPGGAPR